MNVPNVKRSVVVFALLAGWNVTAGFEVSTRYAASQYSFVPGISQTLEVFPAPSGKFKIEVPFPLGVLAYAPDGASLYATRLGVGAGLFRISFNPLHVQKLSGSELIGTNSIAVAARQPDRIVISGGSKGKCGIFEFSTVDGAVKMVAQGAACGSPDPKASWSELHVSADGQRATALRNGRLDLINMANGEVSAFPGNFVIATWSPDGQWIAAVRDGGDDTTLLDTANLKPRKVLRGQEIVWSPDSHYLLATKHSVLCGMDAGTFEAVNIGSGDRQEFAGSRCLINRNSIGWLGIEAGR